MSVLTPIFIIPTYIGLIGLLPSFLAMKLGYKVWYNKHEGEISNRRPKIDIRT